MVFLLKKKVKASKIRFLQFDGTFFPVHPAMEQLSSSHQPSAVQNMCGLKLQNQAARNPHTSMKNWAISTKTVELQGGHKIYGFVRTFTRNPSILIPCNGLNTMIFLASNCHSGQTTQKIHLAKFVPPPVVRLWR
jgi:hypothetical protein